MQTIAIVNQKGGVGKSTTAVNLGAGLTRQGNRGNQIYELTLSGVNFDIKNTDSGWAIMVPGKVILADGTENRVSTVSSNKTVVAINTPEITGSGSLTVSATSTSDESGASCYGIYSMKDLTLNQCSIVVDGVTCSSSTGSATGIFAAMGRTLTITANTAKNNTITIKNVQGTTTRALGAAKNIVAKDAFVSGAKDSFTSGKTKTISFKDPKVPVIVSFAELPPEPEAATFTDGLGKTDCTFDTYQKNQTNKEGYTFAGWFDGDGNELTSAGAAVVGKTYTAKWTKNGKTVRTTGLDLMKISESNTFGATLADGVYTNADEGWSWDTKSQTLTLNGVTIDAQLDKNAEAAIGASGNVNIITAEGTENFVYSHSENKVSTAIYVEGNLTISGKGKLTVTGETAGIDTEGDIHINAPLSASAISSASEAAAIRITSEDPHEITIDPSLTIKQPEGGYIGKDEMCILGKEGTPAKEVVIGAAATAGATPLYVNGVDMLNSSAPAGVSYDKSTNTLTLTNANLSVYHSATIGSGYNKDTVNAIIYAEGSLTINLVGNSTITYPGGATGQLKGIYNGTGDLTFTGDGSLKIENAVGASGSSNTCVGIALANGTLTVNGPTITIDAKENTKPSCLLEYGIQVSRGAFVFESGNMTLRTQGSEEAVALYIQNFTETASKLGSGAKLIADANEGCGLYINNKSFIIDAGASLRATGQKQALYLQDVDFKSADSSSLSVAISETYNAEKSALKSIPFDNNDFSGSEKYKTIEVTASASTPAAPTFTDGFGKTIENADTYKKGTTTNDKGYTFAGWFDGDGKELTSAADATVGTTYTAKWTKNGKTVRTKALDLTKIGEDNTFGATLTDGVYTNADEGWSWNPTTKTLTLSGATMDIQLDSKSYIGIHLPADGILTTAANMENKVSVNAERSGAAITGAGNITVEGQGTLSVIGVTGGICTDGDITINAPISVSITGEETAAIYIESEQNHSITIHDALNILTPAGGRINTGRGTYIAESDGTIPARNVVIGVAKKYTVTYNTNGGSAVDSATVSEGHKLTAPEAPTKDGYTFHGWYKDAAFTNRWNFDADTVTGNTTLYAKWTEATKIYGISGTVYESNGTTPASDVSVKLMKGDTLVASTTSATDGTYSFTGIAPGVYNIVAEEDDTTQTTLVIITNQSETGKDITMPNGKVNSKLTVNGADTPDVVAGGLDKEAAAVKNENSSATLVKVEMTVESKSGAEVNSTDKTNIEAVASGKILEY